MKKIQVTLGQLDRASFVLRQLATEKLPFKASYWLRRDIDKLQAVYKPFVEAKQDLFKKYAETDTQGNVKLEGMNVKLIDEKKEAFWEEYKELAEKEIDLEICPLKLEWFDKVEISIEELSFIEFLFEEPDSGVQTPGQ